MSAEQRTLTVVADDWPPFSGSALPNGGMSLDVISTVLQRAGYKVETQVVPWARIMSGARSGEFDVIGSLFEDADMKKFVSYGDPFFSTDVRLVQPAGGTHRFTSVAALRPFSIAVGDGFVYQDEFDRADYLNKIVVTTALQAIKMVAFGRADLTLDSADVVRHAIQNDDPTLSARVEFAPGVLVSQNIHMAVNSALPDSADIVADFNRVLAEMKADGSLDALLAVHVGQQGTE
ncbi:MAG: transporter substrate-binding domain-containing protein [Pseudomonadota bacterium]